MATQDEKISQLANLLPLTGGERIIADQDGETRGGRIDSILALVSALISTVITDQGNYDASTNVFPSTGGTGSAGSIKLGNQFTISVNGTLGGKNVVAPYDTIRAIRDNPGQDPTAWYIQHNNIATTPPTNQFAGTPGRISISIISGIATIDIDTSYNIYPGTGSRILESDAAGSVSATKQLIYPWITDAMVIANITDTSNWDEGVYNGPDINGFYGQEYCDNTYWYRTSVDGTIKRFLLA